MPSLHCPKKEKFVQKWHEIGVKTDAYIIAYPASAKWQKQSVRVKASVLSKRPECQERFEELQEEAHGEHTITIKTLLNELNSIKDLAVGLETPQCSAAVNCIMGKAKLVGLDVVKVKIEASEELTPWGMIVVTKED